MSLLLRGDSFDQQLRSLSKGNWHTDSMGRHFPTARISSTGQGVGQVGRGASG